VNNFIGVGCLVQGLGMLVPFVGFVYFSVGGAALGVIILLVLLILGSRMSRSWRCGACANPIASGDVRMCPTCKMTLVA
jgi:hypothetical protein